jgi:PAS domain S-box-containing protein
MHADDVSKWDPPPFGHTITTINRARHRDGTWRWLEVTTTNLTHDPAIRAYVSNYRDITARKLADQRQLELQRRLEYLLSATSAITYSAPPGRAATFISASVKSVLGYTPEQFYQEPGMWLPNIHPDDLERVKEGVHRVRTTGHNDFEYRFRHADGSYRWMRDEARCERDEHGNPIEIVGYWLDITDQVKARESVQRSEANFRQLIERSPSVTLVQRDGVYIYVNPALVALFGYDSAEDLIGKRVLDNVHPDDRERIRERMQRALQPGGTPPAEVRVLRRDGTELLLEMEGMVVDFDGKPSTLAIGRDVSERRELFARMALADRMLTVGTLAAGVAHEINNPLAYVASNLELLSSEVANLIANVPTRLPPRELPALISDAREGVGRVSAIVRDLRALSRPDDDSRGPVDVAAVLASSIKMAHNEIRHRARVVETHAAKLPRVFAHTSRLGQVFLNLLINAAQAIPEGHADRNEIRVRTAVSADGGQVQIEIEDTGIGIPPLLQRRIFDPFFTTKAPGVGMGLGLAISHQIVRSMDGEISVESSPGVGTTFRVTLPVAAEPPAVECTEPRPGETAGTRILLIDDEAALGRVLRVLLGDHDVVAVTCAREALDRLAHGEAFDVILCDLMMPDISGIELYDQIAPAYRERVVFMTGGAFTQQARDFLARCERPHLDKPFSEHALRDAIARVRATLDTRSDPTAAPA